MNYASIISIGSGWTEEVTGIAQREDYRLLNKTVDKMAEIVDKVDYVHEWGCLNY